MDHTRDKKPFFTRPGIILSVIMLVLHVAFCGVLISSQMIPMKLMLPVTVVLLL